jgi:hypothetical protein
MTICRETKKWVEEEVEQPIERWVERSERRCKKYKWYDPRGWFCWLVTWLVKIIEFVIVTIGKWVVHVVCVVVTTIVNAAAFVVGLVLSIPLIGPLIRAIARFGAEVISQFFGLFDRVAWWAGIKIKKNLRVCIIILRADRLHVTQPEKLADSIEWAKQAFSQARVNLVITEIKKIHDDAPDANLDVRADAGAVWDELWAAGSWFETAANGYCFDQAGSRGILLGSPVIAFVVRTVAGQTTGCSLWTLTDYVTLQRALFDDTSGRDASGLVVRPQDRTDDITVFAHELGHACSLPHLSSKGRDNLMFPTSSPRNLRGLRLTAAQVHVLRSSRHVTYL